MALGLASLEVIGVMALGPASLEVIGVKVEEVIN